MTALRNNGIRFVSFDQGTGRNKNAIEQFKNDETITVFLLHAERERWVYLTALAGH
jgi:E3 ubiquitin-protein ligase SHPRH